MATIRVVDEALSQDPGVDAVVVGARDRLPIQSHARRGVDPETAAALQPPVINWLTQQREAAGRREYGAGQSSIDCQLAPQLEHVGHRVSLARTLAQARSVLADSHLPVDALPLDLHLPDGSGLDLLRDLRGAPATRSLPVIVLTAEGEERILDEAQELGSALLTKPFSPSKLIARIGALLGDSPPIPPSQPLGESA